MTARLSADTNWRTELSAVYADSHQKLTDSCLLCLCITALEYVWLRHEKLSCQLQNRDEYVSEQNLVYSMLRNRVLTQLRNYAIIISKGVELCLLSV